MSRKTSLATAWGVLALAVVTAAQSIDLGIIHRIRGEAFERSQVMDHLYYLTDVYGPRLTNSPGFDAAAKWTVSRLKSFGADNAKLEPWGRFGRGWSYSHLTVQMKAPAEASLIGAPLAWTNGTAGPMTGDAILAVFNEGASEDASYDIKQLEEGLAKFSAKYKGQLQGKVVLINERRRLKLPTEAAARRYDDQRLGDVGSAPTLHEPKPIAIPIVRLPSDPEERGYLFDNAPFDALMDYFERRERVLLKVYGFIRDEGALATLITDERGDGGIAFAEAAGPTDSSATPPGPVITLIPEHYNRVVRLLEHNNKVQLTVDLKAQFQDQSLDGRNIVAEIPGGKKRDEIVMLGAHFDSWHSGTGATDNGAGCAVAIEAFRILKSLNLPMDRTVRLALWDGEEQGLLGSRAYVKNHFADPATMALKPEHAKLAGYFNLDNGSGKIRGVYLQGNDMVRPIFDEWLAPFRDLGATTLSIRNTGGTDHLSFDAVGLPGFQFIQDPLDYGTRSHHSHLDTYDRAQAGDLMQASAIIAAFVYETAVREQPLPRKPLPASAPTPHSEAAKLRVR